MIVPAIVNFLKKNFKFLGLGSFVIMMISTGYLQRLGELAAEKTTDLGTNSENEKVDKLGSLVPQIQGDTTQKEVMGIFNLEEWNVKELKQSSGNFYCLRKPKGFEYQYMWHKSLVPVGNFEANFSIQWAKDESYDEEDKRLSIKLGKDIKLFEITLPVLRGQVINFRQWTAIEASPQVAISPNPGQSLIEVIDPSAPVDIKFKTEVLNGNKIRLTMFVEFISFEGRKESDDHTYEIELHHPNPQNLLTEVGIGVKRGGCLEVKNFSI